MCRAFGKFDGVKCSLVRPKVIYVLIHLAGLGVAIWQCNRMGLLPSAPLYSSDELPSPSPFVTRTLPLHITS